MGISERSRIRHRPSRETHPGLSHPTTYSLLNSSSQVASRAVQDPESPTNRLLDRLKHSYSRRTDGLTVQLTNIEGQEVVTRKW